MGGSYFTENLIILTVLIALIKNSASNSISSKVISQNETCINLGNSTTGCSPLHIKIPNVLTPTLLPPAQTSQANKGWPELSIQATEPSVQLQRKIQYIIKTIESGRDSTALWQLNQLLFDATDDEHMTVMILHEASRLYPSSDDRTLLKIFHLVISNVNINPVDVFLLLLDAQYSQKSTSISRLKETVESLTKNVLHSSKTDELADATMGSGGWTLATIFPAPKPESGAKAIKKIFQHIFSAIKPNDAEWLRLHKWLGREFYESLRSLQGPGAYLVAIKSIEAEMKGEMLTANQWFYIQELYHSCLHGSKEELSVDWEEKLTATTTLSGSCNGAFGLRYVLNSHTRRVLSAKSKNRTDAPTVISNYIQSISDKRIDYIDIKIRDDILLAHLTQVVFNAVDRAHFSCNQSRLSLDLLNWLGRNRGIDISRYPCVIERSKILTSLQYSKSKSFGQTLNFIHSGLPPSLEKIGVSKLLELCETEILPQDPFLLGCYLYQNLMTNWNLWAMLGEVVQGQVTMLMSEQILKWAVRVDEDYFEIVPRSWELVKIAFLGDMAAGEPRLWLFTPHAVTGQHFQVGIYSVDKEAGAGDGVESLVLQKIYESFSYIRGNRFASFMSSSTFRLSMLDNMETFYLLREDIPFCLHRDGNGVPASLNLCIGDYLGGERAEFFVCPDENDWSHVLELLKAKYVG